MFSSDCETYREIDIILLEKIKEFSGTLTVKYQKNGRSEISINYECVNFVNNI
jgi:hypothetical protein